MAFVQIIDLHTSKLDDLRKLDQEWLAATEGKRTMRREIVARDRNDPSHYVVMVFFDSYDSAMENSQLPETQAIAEQYTALCEQIRFIDLDVVDDYS